MDWGVVEEAKELPTLPFYKLGSTYPKLTEVTSGIWRASGMHFIITTIKT
jgi:hypothetical protein